LTVQQLELTLLYDVYNNSQQ